MVLEFMKVMSQAAQLFFETASPAAKYWVMTIEIVGAASPSIGQFTSFASQFRKRENHYEIQP